MGNEVSSKRSEDEYSDDDTATDNGKRQHKSSSSRRKGDDDNAVSFLIDSVCSNFEFFREGDSKRKKRDNSHTFGTYSDDEDEDDDEDDESLRDRKDRKSRRGGGDDSYQDDYSEDNKKQSSSRRGRSRNQRKKHYDDNTLDGEEDEDTIEEAGTKEDDRGSVASSIIISSSDLPSLLNKPLASSFAKKCYFTKAGIGKQTQHYEGLTLTGNVVLMLASAMQLKGCPTICDEDLRRVEQTYPNQFSRLPDELLLSSGWRRISKFCHFSNKAIPDGIPFFHSKERLHPKGGYYFLLASAVGMVRPIDVEPINRDTLVVLETDYAAQCDAAPPQLINDPDQWTLVEKFCFFSGGPINTEEDVYYVADFEGNPIFMLAFLSPSLTPEELYRLGPDGQIDNEHGFQRVAAVEEVEGVYDLTERDFDDLKLYHLGPCRALPPYILMPQGWTKVLPPQFVKAKQRALEFAREAELRNPPVTNMGIETQYGEMPLSDGINPHINDPYNQQQQWQHMTNSDAPYNQVGGDFRHPDADLQIHQRHGHDLMQSGMSGPVHDGNYYMSQGYPQEGIHKSLQNNPDPSFQPNQQMQPPQEDQPSYYDPEAGFDRGDEQLPGGYNLPTPHDQRNRDALVQADENTRLVSEEGAFGTNAENTDAMDEPLKSRSNQKHKQSSTPKSSPQKTSSKTESLSPPAKTQGDHTSEFSPHESTSPDKQFSRDEYSRVGSKNSLNDDQIGGNEMDRVRETRSSRRKSSSPSKDRFSPPKQADSFMKTDESGDMDKMDYIRRRDSDTNLKESFELSENRSPKRGKNRRKKERKKSPVRKLPYEESRSAESLEEPAADRDYRMHDDEYFDEKRRGEDYIDSYDLYEERHVPTKSSNGMHLEIEQRFQDEFDYPKDEYDAPNQEQDEVHEQINSFPDEPEPSVDGLSSIGEYVSPRSNTFRMHLQNAASQFSPLNEKASPSSPGRHSPVLSGTSDYAHSQTSHASQAMRGAQELLKRNRQKRLAQNNRTSRLQISTPEDNVSKVPVSSPKVADIRPSFSKESDNKWETSSEVTGSIVSASSIWTDTSITDRTSRRALILQMAKARMKSNKSSASLSNSSPKASPKVKLVENKKSVSVSPRKELPDDKPLGELDFTGELD